MNLKEKLMEDHPQLSEMKIEQIIEESEEKVGSEANLSEVQESDISRVLDWR
jgi:hypothetical protein